MTPDPLSIADAQARVDEWIRSTGKGYFAEMTNLGRLVEEVGELARIYNRTRGELKPKTGDDVSHGALEEEMGDVLFVLICLANQARIDLSAALGRVLEKIETRDKTRHED